jgi:hypothetical protein
MKRVLVGVVWFVVLSILGLAGTGAVAGAKAYHKAHAAGLSDGLRQGAAAGSEVGRKYGTVLLLGALVLSIVGAATGSLPGVSDAKPGDAI